MRDKIDKIPQRLRLMAYGPVDAVDSGILCAAANRIEALEKGLDDCTRRDTMNCLAVPDYQREAIRVRLLHNI